MLQGAVLARGPRAVRPGHGGPTTASSPPTSSLGRPEGHAAVSSEAATRMSGLRIGPPGGSCGLGGMPRGRRRSVSEMLGTHRLTPDRYSPRTEPRQGSALPAKGRGELGYTRPRGHRHCLWVPEGGGARPGPLGRGLQPLPPSPMRAGRPRGTRRCHASAPGTRSRGSGVNAGARSGRWARRPSQCPRSWRWRPPSPPPPAWRAPAPQPLRAAAGFFTEFLMLKRPVHPCEFPCDFVFRTGEHLRTFSEWRNHSC